MDNVYLDDDFMADADMRLEGKFTAESFARKKGIALQSAINLLSAMKKKGLVRTSGGGRQKRIYAVSKTPRKEPNGLFYLLNKHSPEKIHPPFEHFVKGRYGPEHALIDGLLLQKEQKDSRIREAMLHLFRHVKDWKKLFFMAREKGLVRELQELYAEARSKVKCRKMPARYEQ